MESDQVLAPVAYGATRIGGRVQVNDKAGCSLMVTASLYEDQLLPPFLVMGGSRTRYLIKQCKDRHRTGQVEALVRPGRVHRVP